MIKSIDEYLLRLKKELSGCDPAMIQNALSDSEEHLREALRSVHDLHPDRSESDILQEVIENYGSGISVFVGEGSHQSSARYFLESPDEVARFLTLLLEQSR